MVLVLSLAIVAMLLVTLSQRSSATRRWVSEVVEATHSYEHAEHTLQNDLLNARAGILRNYDPINSNISLAYRSLHRLADLTSSDEFRRQINLGLRKLAEQEALAEQFKSKNALLQNSLARFTSIGNAIPQTAEGRDLSARILQLTLDTSPSNVQAARKAVVTFERTESSSWPNSELVAHAKLLTALLPEIDQILVEFRSQRLASVTDQLHAACIEEAREQEASLRVRQFALVGLSILSLALLILLAASLRRRTHEFKHRIQEQRLCAAVANLFINASGTKLEDRIESAVKWLAAHIDARQGHLRIHSGLPEQRFDWSVTSRSRSSLDALFTIAQNDLNWRNDILFVSHASRQNSLGEKMLQHGITSLLLIRALHPVPAVLAFELRRSPRAILRRSDGVIAAFYTILEAVQRDALATERVQFERQLARARRMETIGAMASGVAHNFNNIVGVISGFCEMAEAHTPSESVAKKYLGEISQAVCRAHDLTDKILSFAKHDQGRRELIHIPHLIEETARIFRAASHCTTEVFASLNGGSAFAMGNATQIQQVLLNILNNAANANIHGKPIGVELGLSTLRSPHKLSHSGADAGQYAVITVRDEGVGISSAALPRIFEPFFTTRPAGTGLGLSTAWEIVQEHGGSIDVQSELGIGSRFSIWLPVSSADRDLTPIN